MAQMLERSAPRHEMLTCLVTAAERRLGTAVRRVSILVLDAGRAAAQRRLAEPAVATTSTPSTG